MSKGLLLGNGINAHIGITDLSVKCIGRRFLNNVICYIPIIEELFHKEIKKDFLAYLDEHAEENGIEILAGILYQYIKNNKYSWTENDEYRLQDVVTCICLTSIFYTKNGKIDNRFKIEKVPNIDNYDYIFTLNYVEFWDTDNRCIHLHGKVDFENLSNKTKPILISSYRMCLTEYVKAVQKIEKCNNIIEIDPLKIVLAPNGVEKNELVSVTGLYPSENLFPADDLFLIQRRGKLYKELNKITELDIFGMSPNGDESIIKKINNKNNIRVFVYEKDTNIETEEWKKKLSCKYELLDSSKIN